MNKVKVVLHLDTGEFDTLIKAIDYFNYASSVFEYGEHIETCQMIHNKIMSNLAFNTKEIH